MRETRLYHEGSNQQTIIVRLYSLNNPLQLSHTMRSCRLPGPFHRKWLRQTKSWN
jgi:hypothetical protein